ncbi:MAG: hypothetical protein ACYDA4_16345 [Ignavibacteriaceae bacterium]
MEDINYDIAYLIITNISATLNSLSIEFNIGPFSYTPLISLDNNFSFVSNNLNGIVYKIELINIEYILFITGPELDLHLSKYQTDIKYKPIFNGDWFVEFVKTFQNYEIYFFRPYNEILETHLIETNNIFNGYYQTIEKSKINQNKYILLNLPIDHKLVVNIENVKVSCHKFKYQFNILFGKFTLNNIEYFAYIIHFLDLIQILSKIGFKQHRFFEYLNKLYPIPNFPIINFPINTNLNRIDLYNCFITRSQILSIFISSEASINNLLKADFDEHMYNPEQDDLIKIDEMSGPFGSYYKANKEGSNNEMPYKNLIVPESAAEGSEGFLKEVEDYDLEHKSNFLSYSSEDEPVEDEHPEHWDSLDFTEQYSENDILAEKGYAEYGQNNFADYDNHNFKYFDSEIGFARELISNISCSLIDNNYAVFEIKRGKYYQHKECPIFLNPFISRFSTFSGILQVSEIGDFQFIIVEKCPKIFLKRILREVVNFKEFRIIKTNNFFICFNLIPLKGFKVLNTFSEK